MRRVRSILLPPLLVALHAGWAAPRADDPAYVAALKSKGLTKAGTAFVLDDEKPVLAKLKEARAAFNAYAALGGEQSRAQELAQQAGQLEEQRAALQAQLDELNEQIGTSPGGSTGTGPSPGGGPGGGGPGGGPGGGMPGRAMTSPLTTRRDQVRQMLAQVAAEQKAVKAQAPAAKDAEKLDQRVQKADEAFKATLADLRTRVDAVRQAYAALAVDAVAAPALAEAKRANPRLHLGPSDALNAGARELERAEQRFLGKRTATAPRRGQAAKARAKK